MFELTRVAEPKMRTLKNGAYVVEVCEYCGHTGNTLVPRGADVACPGCGIEYFNYDMEWQDSSGLGDGRSLIQDCLNGKVVEEYIVDADGYMSANQSRLVDVDDKLKWEEDHPIVPLTFPVGPARPVDLASVVHPTMVVGEPSAPTK